MDSHIADEIVAVIDAHLEKYNLPSISAPEANKLLAEKGLLIEYENSGQALGIHLSNGKCVKAYQIAGSGSEWFIPSSKRNLLTLLMEQHVIWTSMNESKAVLECILRETINNTPNVQYSPFFAVTAFQYYRCLVIDLCTLFVDSNSHKSSFNKLLTPLYSHPLYPASIDKIEQLLKKDYKDSIAALRVLRDRQYAHYDFMGNPSISFNFDKFDIVRNLFEVARDIIIECGDNNFMDLIEFSNQDSHALPSLEDLISKVNAR